MEKEQQFGAVGSISGSNFAEDQYPLSMFTYLHSDPANSVHASEVIN